MAEVYTFDEQSIVKLSRMVHKLQHEVTTLRERLAHSYSADSVQGFYIAAADDEVTARSDTDVGTGKAKLYRVKTDNSLELITRSVDVVNMSTSAISNDTYFTVTRDPFGRWVTGGLASGGNLWGKLDTTLSAGSSATMSVWESDGVTQTDTGDNVTVYDMVLGSGSIAAGKRVATAVMNGFNVVIAAEC